MNCPRLGAHAATIAVTGTILLVAAPAGASASSPATTEQVKTLQSQVNRLENDVTFVRILVFALLGGGFIIGLVTTIRSDQRNTELHRLSFAGETAAQDRAEQVHTTFLDASQHTLALVNETLQLAKDASQRADEALALRAKRAQDQVESRARELVRPLIIRPDLHSIVTDSATRRQIVDLAGEIGHVQGYLEIEGIHLSAACQFVLGLNAHFQGESLRAIKHLTLASADGGAHDSDLEIAALYWSAYELNNTGKYGEAKDLFRKAAEREGKDRSRHWELVRMLHETQFFELADAHTHTHRRHNHQDVEGLLKDLEREKKQMPDVTELKKARGHLDQTEAHLLFWAADPPSYRGTLALEQRQRLEESHQRFVEAVELETTAPELWTMLGRAEAAFHLGLEFDCQGYQKALELAKTDAETRVEHRTLVSLEEARLIAQVRLAEPKSEIERTNERLRENLKALEPHMCVFSHFQKCNLQHGDFRDELDKFWEAYLADPDARTVEHKSRTLPDVPEQ